VTDANAQAVTPELRQWIVEQAQAGHGAEAVLEAMKSSGWQEEVALAALEETLRHHLQRPGSVALPAQLPAATALPDLSADAGHDIWAHDRAVKVVMSLKHPRVVVFANVLSPEECHELMGLAATRLSRSETVVHATGGSEINAARTSEGMFFTRGESELITRVEARLSALLNWPVENGEGLQVLRYAPGAEYKPHFDYFDPEQPGTAAVLRRGGQRLATLVLYLNTPQAGGATVFPDAGLTVHPIQGHGVFFNYDRPSAATKSLHGGAPVIEGEKWVATKWMRQGRFD
jgi:prolyl 4-hydroxylase